MAFSVAIEQVLTGCNYDSLPQSAGGFDVAEAARELEFRTAPSQSRVDAQALEAARARLQDARAEQLVPDELATLANDLAAP